MGAHWSRKVWRVERTTFISSYDDSNVRVLGKDLGEVGGEPFTAFKVVKVGFVPGFMAGLQRALVSN